MSVRNDKSLEGDRHRAARLALMDACTALCDKYEEDTGEIMSLACWFEEGDGTPGSVMKAYSWNGSHLSRSSADDTGKVK